MLEGGSERAQEGKRELWESCREMLREGEGAGPPSSMALADSWGQSRMEAIGLSSPQTSANTDVRHVTCAESSGAEEQYLESIMKGSRRRHRRRVAASLPPALYGHGQQRAVAGR